MIDSNIICECAIFEISILPKRLPCDVCPRDVLLTQNVLRFRARHTIGTFNMCCIREFYVSECLSSYFKYGVYVQYDKFTRDALCLFRINIPFPLPSFRWNIVLWICVIEVRSDCYSNYGSDCLSAKERGEC